ncbi:hypothetical protein ACEWY4_016044 [Coilia grayii]|uniref:G-protein coupled receptors family 1 profile domain-containing protein n=1 Tax=Coilia grayii TaxID=363190 RepID=A0ABD1JQJ8_9TELE
MHSYNMSNLPETPLKDQVGSRVLGFCFLLGTPGNILVVMVILHHFKRENFTLHLMLNLAASDILCLLNTPLAIYNLLWGWSIGDALVQHWLTAQLKSHCRNMEYLNHSSSNSSSISLKQQVSTGLLGVCFLLGVPANVAVVVFILRHFKKDNFTLHLMLNLAASDILRLVLVPLGMYTFNFDWALGRTLCKLMYLLAFTSAYSSVLTVTLMSVQRYVVVLHRSHWAKLGSKGEKVLLFCLWT